MALLGLVAGSAGGRSTVACHRALIISAKTAKVLRRPLLTPLSIVSDGRDGWYVADSRLWHVRRDGSLDETWHSAARRTLTYDMRFTAPGMLARDGDRLYLAGRQRVVAVDAITGRVLWRSPASAGPTSSGRRATITALAAGSRAVYVGGTFTSLGSTRRVGLAALDASTGRLLGWHTPAVRGATLLALSGSRLYFSGGRLSVEAVRTSDGRPTSFVPRASIENPTMLALWGRHVLIGCGSRWSSCETDTGVFDSRTGRRVHKFGFDQVAAAGAVGLSGSTAYLGSGPEGSFGGQNYLIAIDLRTGKYERWFPKTAYYSSSSAIAVSRDRVLVAGSFCPGT
jgi:outer membrane protein assembly factor BamB